jgi:DNA gyrase subunit A
VISLSILRHTDATGDERAAYLKHAGAVRRGLNGADAEESAPTPGGAGSAGNDAIELGEQSTCPCPRPSSSCSRFPNGYGKRSSSYEYRITGRGGKGIVAMDVRERDGTIRKRPAS